MQHQKEKKRLIQKAIEWAEKKGFHSIKARYGEWEKPKTFRSVDNQDLVAPDMSGIRRTKKNYFEIGLKVDKGIRGLITKWKLLATLAAREGGKLYILAPRGHRSFVKTIIDRHKLNSKLVGI